MQMKNVGVAVALAATLMIPACRVMAEHVGAVAVVPLFEPTDVTVETEITYVIDDVTYYSDQGFGYDPQVDHNESRQVPGTTRVKVTNWRSTEIDLSSTTQFPNRPSVTLFARADTSGSWDASVHAEIHVSSFGTAGADSYGYNFLPDRGQIKTTNTAITSGLIPAGHVRAFDGSLYAWWNGGTGL